MPSYNQANFLDEAIGSVLQQDYPNIELVVIDGGSNDKSVCIIRNHSDRIAYWISEADHGQSDALNKGFRRITGEIVGWLNSDDLYQPDIFDTVAEQFADPNVGIVMCSHFGFINSEGNARGRKENRFTDHSSLIRYWATEGITMNQPSVFFRRELIQAMDPVVDPHLHYAMDYDLWLRLTQDHSLRVVPGHWANYRYHESSKTVGDARKFVSEWYSVSQNFWGKKYSLAWWKHWLDHFYHWSIRRPVGIILTRLSGTGQDD